MAGPFTWTNYGFMAQLDEFDKLADRAIRATMMYHAPRIEAIAKRNAPWTDRTTNARNGLFATTVFGGSSYAIVLAHSMDYGIWLEVRFSGRYAIINPTILAEGAAVMRTTERLFDMIFGGATP